MVGDAEHGDIIEGVEIILGKAPAADRLDIGDFRPLIADITDKSPEIGVGVIDLS